MWIEKNEFSINTNKILEPKTLRIQKAVKYNNNLILESGDNIQTNSLTFRSKHIQENIEIYFSIWFRRNAPKKVIEILPHLTLDEFLKLYKKESERSWFENKTVEYYESLLKKLEDNKNNIEKKEYKLIEKNIEEKLRESYNWKKETYFDKIVKEDKKLNKLNKLIQNKNSVFKYTWMNKKESNLSIYDSKYLSSNREFEKKDKQNFETFKISNNKLKKLFSEDIDLVRFLRWQLRGKWAIEKLDIIFDNLDEDLIPLLFILFRNKNNIDKLEKLKKKLDSLNWKWNIDKNFYRAVKLEIQSISNIDNTKNQFETLTLLFNENPQEAKKITIEWITTKKNNYLLEDYIKYLTENRWRGWTKKYKNRHLLENIIKQVKNTNQSKNTKILLDKLETELSNILSLIASPLDRHSNDPIFEYSTK